MSIKSRKYCIPVMNFIAVANVVVNVTCSIAFGVYSFKFVFSVYMLTFKHELLSISNNMMNSFEQNKEKLYLFNIQNIAFML